MAQLQILVLLLSTVVVYGAIISRSSLEDLSHGSNELSENDIPLNSEEDADLDLKVTIDSNKPKSEDKSNELTENDLDKDDFDSEEDDDLDFNVMMDSDKPQPQNGVAISKFVIEAALVVIQTVMNLSMDEQSLKIITSLLSQMIPLLAGKYMRILEYLLPVLDEIASVVIRIALR